MTPTPLPSEPGTERGLPWRERAALRHQARALLRTALVLFPISLASVEDAQAQDHLLPSGGIHLGYTFGAHSGFSWGAHLAASYLAYGFNDCVNANWGGGGLFRVNVVGLRPRFILGAQAGGVFTAFGGGLELGLLMGKETGTAPYLGLYSSVLGLTTEASYAPWLREGGVYGGFGYPRYGIAACSVGRALRPEAQLASAALEESARETLTSSAKGSDARSEYEVAAAHYQDVAQSECNAVAAFLQLFAELDQAGAPNELLMRCLASARDEVRHAVAATGLATALAPMSCQRRPTLPEFSPRQSLRLLGRAEQAAQLAEESVMDGLFAEGAAVQQAELSQSSARSTQAQGFWAQIAKEERVHAQLGTAVMDWAIDEHPEPTKQKLSALLPRLSQKEPPRGLEHLSHFGVAGDKQLRHAHEVSLRATGRELGARLG